MKRDAAGLLLAAAVAAPALVGLAYALAAALGLAGFGPARLDAGRIARVLAEPAVLRALLWSLWVAAAATALATAGAVLVAVAYRGGGRLDRIGRALAVLPLPLPHLVAAALGVLVLGQSGLLARAAHAAGLVATPSEMPALIYDGWGVGLILVLAWKELPFLALLALSVLATRGAVLEETARSLGAGPLATFRLVTWPVLWRGLLPAAVAVFVFAAGSYETAVLLAPSDPLALPLLTVERHLDPSLDRRADAYVLALAAFGIAILAAAAHEWARARAEAMHE